MPKEFVPSERHTCKGGLGSNPRHAQHQYDDQPRYAMKHLIAFPLKRAEP